MDKASSISPTFCILPWIHLATFTNGNISTCCIAQQIKGLNLNHLSMREAWNSDQLKAIRIGMLNGQRIPQCRQCYQQEKSGLPSHRNDENNIWSQRLSEEEIAQIISHTSSEGSLSTMPITIDLRPGNICNLKCITCSPAESTAWYNDAQFLAQHLSSDAKNDWQFKCQVATNLYHWYKSPAFVSELFEQIPSLRHVIFGGGEPLLLPEHDAFLEHAIKTKHSEHIELRYHTNGTVIKQAHIERWKHFKHVQIMVSVDGYQVQNDYLRYPSKWDHILDILNLLDNAPSNIEPQILVTISLLNLYSMPEFCDWLLSQNYKKIGRQNHHGLFHPGILFWPPYLSVTVLPPIIKDEITGRIFSYLKTCQNPQAQRLHNIVDHMNSKDNSHLYPQALEYLAMLDQLRNLNHREIFPHLSGNS